MLISSRSVSTSVSDGRVCCRRENSFAAEGWKNCRCRRSSFGRVKHKKNEEVGEI